MQQCLRKHLENVYTRLEVTNRTAATSLLYPHHDANLR
jgi:DNA-binding NarL/FixJ family response regulator